MKSAHSTAVTRRCVLYLSGFDPKGANHYHTLFREEGARQSTWGGWRLSVGPRRRLPSGDSHWQVDAQADSQGTRTDYVFLQWDDLVRANWPRQTHRLWWLTLATTWFNLRQGSLWRMFRLSWPPVLALFLPFLLVLFLLLGIPALMGAIGLATRPHGPPAVAIAAALVAGVMAFGAGRRLENKFSMYWLMRSYAFTSRQVRGLTPDLEARLDRHADTLVERVACGDYDEVLLVGHSTGGNMAVSVMARALTRQPNLLSGQTFVSMLTLGQWVPLIGTLPQANGFRSELERLSLAHPLVWIDFSAPPDGCCFALTDPFSACGIDRPIDGGGVQFKALNPRFADMFAPGDYAALKRDKLQLHFQYLKASSKPVAYDYFQIVAGPVLLGKRFEKASGIAGYRGLSGVAWLDRVRAP